MNLVKLKLSKLLIFTILFLMNPNLFGQERAYVGVKYGAGLSRFYFASDRGANKYIVMQDFVLVDQYGLVFNHMNERNFGFQLEILMTKNAWQENIDLEKQKKRTVTIEYIEVPLLSQYRIGKKNVGLVINVGSYIGYQQKLTVDSIGGAIDWEADKLERFAGVDTATFINYDHWGNSPIDFGLKGGLAFDLDVNIFNFQLQVLYNQSLQNILEPHRDGIYRSLNQGLFVNAILKVRLFRNDYLPVKKYKKKKKETGF